MTLKDFENNPNGGILELLKPHSNSTEKNVKIQNSQIIVNSPNASIQNFKFENEIDKKLAEELISYLEYIKQSQQIPQKSKLQKFREIVNKYAPLALQVGQYLVSIFLSS